MIFGNSQDFAIEAYHEPSGPKWDGFGRLCLYIQGKQLGDIGSDHCSLFHVTDRFRKLSELFLEIQRDSCLGILWDESFASLSDKEIFDRVNEALFVGEPSEDSAQFSNFDFLTNTGEMFNGVKTFIACRPDGHVLILYEFGNGTFGSGSCLIEVFTAIANSYLRWFDEQISSKT
ncbi:MAG: hypothetical protein V4672_22955 [Verrucomicrobiota bacterium]